MAQSPWVNSDGLVIKFGSEEPYSLHQAGTYSLGAEQVSEVIINLDELTQTETILNYAARIPSGAHITHARVTTLVTAATGVAIDVGLVYYSGTTLTELDYNGILAAHITASMNTVGEMQDFYKDAAATTQHDVLDGTGTPLATAGVLIGSALATTAPEYYISASATTATAFTQGRIRLEVFYVPQGINVSDAG